ncbi:MAG TPA: DUF4097 family beta strand repeat-containing protein [Gemmatimonadaceae bacterium]|nr:DUF4097 family beta strand repeat-containing protein [Gemmatimonadaceae bacterium]
MRRIVAAVLALAVLTPAAWAQTSNGNTFTWNGTIPQGDWLNIHNLNGDITVEGTDGTVVRVTGEKHWRNGDPSRVRFQVSKDGGSVTICALWHEDDRCDENGYHSHGDHDDDHNDVSVHFTVQLPKGVKVDAGTVNGGLDINGAGSEVKAHTVNGRVTATTAQGPVNASTVNGSVRVSMDALTGSGDLRFSTVNGSVTVELPSTLNADVDLSTVNGGISSDFPLTISGRMSPRHIHATIGHGGRDLKVSTVNGSVELRKR